MENSRIFLCKPNITIKLVKSSKVDYIKNFNLKINKTTYVKSLGRAGIGEYRTNICSKKQYSWLWWTLEV